MKGLSIIIFCCLFINTCAKNDDSTMKKSNNVEEDKCLCEEKCSQYVSWVNVTAGCFLIFVFIVFIVMLIIKRDKKADVEELTIEQIDRSLEERRKHNDELQKQLYRQRLRLLQKM